jgi:hypothetical protein
MRRLIAVGALTVAGVAITLTAPAQEGFPLDGTWRGTIDGDAGTRQVVIVMSWDGERINGVIDPGPGSTEFASAELDPSDWTVSIEADPSDSAPIMIEGTLKDIGSYHRFIDGTWTQDGAEQAVKFVRE